MAIKTSASTKMATEVYMDACIRWLNTVLFVVHFLISAISVTVEKLKPTYFSKTKRADTEVF